MLVAGLMLVSHPLVNAGAQDIPGPPLPAAPPAVDPPQAAPVPAAASKEEATADAAASWKLWVPDGQLVSHNFRVYVAGPPITEQQRPTLKLLQSHAVTNVGVHEAAAYGPVVVAPNQSWIQPRQDGEAGTQPGQGTLLLFDVSNVRFGGKAMTRVRPVVQWQSAAGGGTRISVSEHEVNLGNGIAAALWSVVIVGLTLIVITRLARYQGNALGWMGFMLSARCHLSLSTVQVVCWTIAVGTIVLGYGLVRLDIPEIPESLLVLMGASLVTGGVGFFQGDKIERAKGLEAGTPSWSDLVTDHADGNAAAPSLAKAQMVFWTAILLTLFVTKSMLDGRIWDVPWPLVALMGFSQAGYLAPKFTPDDKKGQPAPAAPANPATPDAAGQ